jgi:hypothetical protein
MGILSSLFGGVGQSAVVAVLDAQLPYGDPEEHARILNEILKRASIKVDRRVHTILMPGCREGSRAILAKVCEHHFSETLGQAYNEDRLRFTPFEYPEGSTSGVIVSHP